jgi:hypothetical protein
MPTSDGFNQDYPLSLFADGPEQQGIGRAWDRAVISSPTNDGFNLLLLFLSDGPEQQGIWRAWDRAAISSPTEDGFNQDLPLPLLADGPEQQGIGKAWDRAVISSRVLKASILVATATAIGIAIPSLGNPVMFFADITALMVDKSALQTGTDQSTPTIQSTADAQALPPTAESAPTAQNATTVENALTGDKIAAASEPAGQIQTENSEPPSEALPTWAAEKDAQAPVGPVQSVQDAPAQVAENARAPLRPMQRHPHVRPVNKARAEIRPVQNPPKKVRREQNARLQVPPARDARAQDKSVQNAQAPSFLQYFGWRN